MYGVAERGTGRDVLRAKLHLRKLFFAHLVSLGSKQMASVDFHL